MNGQIGVITRTEQRRSQFAYTSATEGSNLGGNQKKEYKSYVKSLPMMIKTNGLGATLAFMKAKGGTYDKIYRQIKSWLAENPNRAYNINGNQDLTESIINLNSTQYRMATKEVLDFLQWLRRFADGLINS